MESRHHAVVGPPAAADRVIEELRERGIDHVEPTSSLRYTEIRRQWLERDVERREHSKVDLDGVVRSERVVLGSVEGSESLERFRWDRVEDFRTGDMDFRLQAWKDVEKVLDVTLELRTPPAGSAQEMREDEREHPLPDADVYCRLSTGGRLWTLPLDHWRRGELSPVDRQALSEVIGDRERAVLEAIRPLTRSLMSLNLACDTVVQPLLSPDPEPGDCRPGPFADPRRLGLDCTFDASFGEPCSPEQLRRQKRELAD